MTLVKSIGSVPRVTLKETKIAKTSKRRRKRKRVRRRQNNTYRIKKTQNTAMLCVKRENFRNYLLWIGFELFDRMVFLENSPVEGLYKTM